VQNRTRGRVASCWTWRGEFWAAGRCRAAQRLRFCTWQPPESRWARCVPTRPHIGFNIRIDAKLKLSSPQQSPTLRTRIFFYRWWSRRTSEAWYPELADHVCTEWVENFRKFFDLHTLLQYQDGLHWPYELCRIWAKGKNQHTMDVTGATTISVGKSSNGKYTFGSSDVMRASASEKSPYSAAGQTVSLGSTPWLKSIVSALEVSMKR